MRKIPRFAVYLCILLILNEFGPAHFRRLHALKPENARLAKTEKRIWTAAKTLLTYAFKALQVGSKYFNDITGLVSIISTVYTLIEDCASSSWGAKTKEFTDQAKEIVDRINGHSNEIYAIQLETENLQVKVETLNYNFNHTLDEMDKAGYLSQQFLTILQPDIEAALNETTTELNEQLRKAEAAGTSVDYAVLAESYYRRIDKIINIAVPIFVSAIPRIPKMVRFAKNHLGESKSWKLTNKFKSINLPGTNTKAYKGMKSWFAKNGDYIKTAKVKLRGVVTTKYKTAIKFAEGLKNGFAVLTGFVIGAFNIYNAVKNFGRDECRKLHDKANEALQEVLKANETYTAILKNITAAKNEMIKVKDDMVDQVSNQVFLEDLKGMKENMIAIQGDGNGMQDMIDSTTMYLDEIPNSRDIDQVGALMGNLYETAIGILPFIYQCVNDRANLISTVLRECKKGFRTLEDQIIYTKNLFNFKIEECEQRTGIPYFSDEQLKQMVLSEADKTGFEKECKLNNQDVKATICEYHCQPKKPQRISELLGVSVEGVNKTLKKCPMCEVTDFHRTFICIMKNKNTSDEDIRKSLYQFTLAQIASVECGAKDAEEEEEEEEEDE